MSLAVLGTMLITVTRTRVEDTLEGAGLSKAQADQLVTSFTRAGGGDQPTFGQHAGSEAQHLFADVQLDFASGIRWVLYGMTVAMMVSFFVVLVGLRMGTAPLQPAPVDTGAHRGGTVTPPPDG